jgi:hypothetical protein
MTTSNSFIKQNLVLVVGLTLPVLLIVLFFVATVLPKYFGTPPKYDLIYSVERYDSQPQKYSLKFFIEGDVLKARVSKNKNDYSYNNQQLMRFNAQSDSVQPVDVDVSKLGDMVDGTEIVIEPTKNLKLSANRVAPDGFMLDAPNYRGGLMMDMFSGYRDGNYRIKKGAVAYKIPATDSNYYYSNMQFVGWVVGGN